MLEWISVKERLPGDCVPVLVYAKHINGKYATISVDHIIGYTNGCETWADIDKTWKYSVTHWMPLPEPPKEKTNETPSKPKRGKQTGSKKANTSQKPFADYRWGDCQGEEGGPRQGCCEMGEA